MITLIMLTGIALVVLLFGFLGIRIPFVHANPDLTIISGEGVETLPDNSKRTGKVKLKKISDPTTGSKETQEYRFAHYLPPYQNDGTKIKEEALFED